MHASVIEYHMTNVKEECNSSFSGIDHDVLQACKKEKRKRKKKKKIFLRFLLYRDDIIAMLAVSLLNGENISTN